MTSTRHLSSNDLETAVEILRAEQTLVFPTETVYGLGADARSATAVSRIFAVKARPADNPLIVHVATIEDAECCVAFGAEERMLFERFSPGPISLVAGSLGRVDPRVSAGLDTVAVRMPAHPLAHRLLAEFGGPVAAPSANRSGRPSPTDFASAVGEMDGRAAGILDGGACVHGLESTVARVRRGDGGGPVVEILRPGAVTAEMITEVTGLEACVHGAARGDKPVVSPGTRYTHYRPNARVVLLQPQGATGPSGTQPKARTLKEMPQTLHKQSGERYGAIVLASSAGHREWSTLLSGATVAERPASLEGYAARLYAFFFACEAAGCSTIYCELPPKKGIGVALLNRLEKAAAA